MRRLLGIVFLVSGVVGCDPNPFCLNCEPPLDGAGGIRDGAPNEGGTLVDMRTTDGSVLPDGGPDASCTPEQLQQDPSNCGVCGRQCLYPRAAGLSQNGQSRIGDCQPGFYNLDGNEANGCEYACIPSVPPVEVCDGADNDCNGQTDEGFNLTSDPQNCGACGLSCGLLNATPKCVNRVCQIDTCDAGFADLDNTAINGCEYRCPVFPTNAETCNGMDDDCDGVIDDNPGDVGQSCMESCPAPCTETGTCTSARRSTCVGRCCGICTAGTRVCAGGSSICQAGVEPRLEVCNDVDDNCDGQIDEGFNLQTDAQNCGGCGNVCSYPNAIPSCTNGVCGIASCRPGFANNDGNLANGCEYTCPVNPPTTESCNGRDDDCDGLVDQNDPDLRTPNNFCNQTSLCAGSSPVCRGSLGWVCNYDRNPNVEVDNNGNLVLTERSCDNFDGNCNTQVDESFPNLGRECSAGTGRCQGTGRFVCTGDQLSTVCPAQADATQARDELCNGIDDNCDGQVDERTPAGTRTCYDNNGESPHTCTGWVDPMVRVGAIWVYQYEASRPDATSNATGTNSARACSNVGVLPWSTVTYQQAVDACAAVRDSQGQPMRLCTEAEWAQACNVGVASGNVWSYATNATTYNATTCNGFDRRFPLDPAVWATGTGANCYANQTSGRIYDMSGNVSEWTSTQVVSDGTQYYRVRGGAYNTQAVGINCNFDFTLAVPTYLSGDLGFRCCSNNAP